VQILAVYEDGACAPAEAVKVSVIAPAVVSDGAVEKDVGGLIALTSACGDETADDGETRKPVDAPATTLT
jgi:hypothetical protein